MKPEEKLESLKFIAQLHRSQFNERTRYEWRITFASLTFYVLSVAAAYDDRVTLSCWGRIVLIVFILLLTAITIKYLTHIHMANNKNKTFAENAEHIVEEILQTKIFPSKHSKHWTSGKTFWASRGKWGWIWQVLAIKLFALAAISLLILKDIKTKELIQPLPNVTITTQASEMALWIRTWFPVIAPWVLVAVTTLYVTIIGKQARKSDKHFESARIRSEITMLMQKRYQMESDVTRLRIAKGQGVKDMKIIESREKECKRTIDEVAKKIEELEREREKLET